MDVPSSVWILICWICWIYSGESQHLALDHRTLTWLAAENECKYVYNGYLADKDWIVHRTDINSLNDCTNMDQFWLGNALYRTKYFSYMGCYKVPESFENDAIYIDDKSLARCQMYCFFKYGFAIKGHLCKCLESSHGKDNSELTSFNNCNFDCFNNSCAFYGGSEAVSMYIKRSTNDPPVVGDLDDDAGDPLRDINCIYLDCNKTPENELRISPCTMEPGISVLCRNGEEKDNVKSWEMATDFCRQTTSNLISDDDSLAQHCTSGKKYWSSSRRYEIYIKSEENMFGPSGIERCAFTNSRSLENISWAKCFETRHFLCVTDYDNTPGTPYRCYIDLSTLPPPGEHRSGTEKAHTTVIGVVVGLLCCAAVGLAVFLVLCIRRKRALAEHVQIKENKTYGKSIGYMRGKDLVFSQSTVTSVSSTQPKKDNGKSSNGSFHYDLPKPISDIVHIDSKHGRTSGSQYHSIIMQETSQYDVIVLEQEGSNDGPYATKEENDYDHLREHREKTSGQLPEDEYSKCTENDYDYSMQRSEVSQTAQEDDDYSKCNASNTRLDEDYDHSVQRPETSRIDLDDHEYSKCNDVYTRAENDYDHSVQRPDASRVDLDDNEYSKCNAAYTRSENDYDHSVQKSEISRVDIGDDNGYSKCNTAYCRTENDYDHSVQRPETSRSDIDDDNGYSKCSAAYTRTENEYDHSVQRSEASRVELDDKNGYSHTTEIPDNDVYDRCIRT